MSDVSLHRRGLVKGLLSIPALATLDGCCKLCPTPAQAILNVVLHGAFVLELNQRAGRAFVRIPAVEDHVYKIGHWLNEDVLEPTDTGKPLRIRNIVGGKTLPTVNNIDDNDAVIRKSLKPAKQPRTIIELPLPKGLTLARSAKLIDDEGTPLNFFQPTDLLNQPRQLAMTLVLTYGVDLKSDLPAVDGHSWPPSINLHVFAESCHDPTGSHTLDAFNAVCGLYEGLSSLEFDRTWCPPKDTTGCITSYERGVDADLPNGLCREEILSLAERELIVPQCLRKGPPVPSGGHHVGTCLHLVVIT